MIGVGLIGYGLAGKIFHAPLIAQTAGLELRARHDMQIYRVELPGPKVSKDVPSDAKVTLTVNRSQFNDLATKGHIRDWRQAFEHGDAKATGIDQVMRLIVNVVERQEERSRTRRASHH